MMDQKLTKTPKEHFMSTESVQESHTEELMTKHNVVGTAVGKKWVDGVPHEDESIIVFVKKKYTKHGVYRKFTSNDMIPDKLEGIPTDVIEVGNIIKQGFKSKIRPIKPGYSCGHEQITAGTIGGIFYDKDGSTVILSNNHVAANENRANRGDIIYQPGPMDFRGSKKFIGWSNPNNLPYIGTLKDFVEIGKSGNVQDSAIVQVHQSFIDSNLIDPIYPIINKSTIGFGKTSQNMQVQKCGRTTGYTTGRVLGSNATFTIDFDLGPVRFDKCVVTSSMSKGGDSGSVIHDMDMNAVGLLFAGSNKVTLCNPIEFVQQRYGLSIWGGPQESIDFASRSWRLFTTDGSANIENNVATFKDNTNHHCFFEHSLRGEIRNIECTINTGTDKGATWGPGLVLQFPTGMLKINLRHNGPFGGYINDTYSLNVGKTKPNKDYRVRFRKADNKWFGEIEDNNIWYAVVTVPTSIFPFNPVSVRIGKTGDLGSTNDFGPANSKSAGVVGTCSVRDFISS